MENTKEIFGDKITFCNDPYEAAEGAAALAIMTEWNVFRTPDFDKLKSALNNPVIYDGRNLYDVNSMQQNGFKYYSIGRKYIS